MFNDANQRPADPMRWLEMLNRLSRKINIEGQDLSMTLQSLAVALTEELNVDAVAIWGVEHATNFTTIEASTGLSERYVRFFNKTDRIPVGMGIAGGVMAEKKSLSIKNLEEYAKFGQPHWHKMLEQEGVKAVFAAPIFLHENIIGALIVYYKAEHEAEEVERLCFEILANQLAAIIVNGEQYHKIAKNADLLKAQIENMVYIQKVTQLLNLYLYESLDVSLAYVGDYFVEKFGVHGLAVFKLDEGTGELPLAASHKLSNDMLAYYRAHVPTTSERTIIGLAYETRKPQMSTRVFTDDRITKEWSIALAADGLVAMGAFPLSVQGRAIGVLVSFYDRLHEFSIDEITILDTFAQYFAVALENVDTFHRLISEREKTKSMVDSLEDGLLVYDKSGIIIDANPRLVSLLNIELAAILGKTMQELADSGADVAFVAYLSQLVLGEGEVREVSDVRTQGTFHVSQVPLRDEDGSQIGYMRVVHDVTQEKVVERLKSNFVTTASHQLRTPLTGIKWGLLEMERRGDGVFSQEQQVLLKKIIHTSDNVIALINEILDVSKIENGSTEYAFSLGTVSDIIDELLLDLEINIEKQQLTIVKEYADESVTVMRDREKLSLVIRNLLDNAIKYTPAQGTIRVTVAKKDTFLVISISDTGMGIPEKDKLLLFNKFFRSGNAIRQETQGSGLGLYFAKNIVEKHNGQLTFESTEGAGTTFIVSLPTDLAHMPKSS